MRKRLVVLAGAAALLVVGAPALPASAAPTGSTAVTFAISAGALNITVPATANIGSGAPGSSFSGQLGPVTVTDSRGLLLASWSTTVTSTNFTTGAGTAPETIAAGSVSYASGTATTTTGLGVFLPGQPTTALAVPLDTTNGPVAFTKLVAVGNNSATWNPTLVVNAPAAAVAGTYTGTVTHSVA